MRGSSPQYLDVARGLAIGVLLLFALFPPVAGATSLSRSASIPLKTNSYGLVNAVACPSVSQCTAVGDDGRTHTFNPARPGSVTITTIDPTGSLSDVACPTVSECIALDGPGRAVTFNPAQRGAPVTITTVDPTGSLNAVACPSVSQCTAVDDSGLAVTFDPATPGTPATSTTVDPRGALSAVACPSRSKCIAVDGYGRAVTFNPAKPRALATMANYIDALNHLKAVACPSRNQCTAIDDVGRAVTFNPAQPALSVKVRRGRLRGHFSPCRLCRLHARAEAHADAKPGRASRARATPPRDRLLGVQLVLTSPER